MPKVRLNPSIDEGLVLHLPCTEGIGTKVFDRSENEYHGDFPAATRDPTWVTGKDGIGKALSFDGINDYLRVSPFKDFDATSPITTAFWMYPISGGFAEQHTVELNLTQFYIYGTESAFRFAYKETSVIGDLVIHPYNTWYHVVSRRDAVNSEAEIAVNGQVVASGAITPINPGVSLTIGTLYNLNAAYSFKGYLQDIRVFDRLVSYQEIRTLSEMRRRF